MPDADAVAAGRPSFDILNLDLAGVKSCIDLNFGSCVPLTVQRAIPLILHCVGVDTKEIVALIYDYHCRAETIFLTGYAAHNFVYLVESPNASCLRISTITVWSCRMIVRHSPGGNRKSRPTVDPPSDMLRRHPSGICMARADGLQGSRGLGGTQRVIYAAAGYQITRLRLGRLLRQGNNNFDSLGIQS